MGILTGENHIPIPMGMGIHMGIPIPTVTLVITLGDSNCPVGGSCITSEAPIFSLN